MGGGGETGAGPCERCGQVGPIRKVHGIMYLCPQCRQVYEFELAHKTQERPAQKKEEIQTTRKT